MAGGWGGGWTSPEDQAESDRQRDAALEAQARAKLAPFERRLLDVLGEISASLSRITDAFTPAPMKPPPVPIALTRTTEGDSGGVSAEPVDQQSPPPAGPGSARPTSVVELPDEPYSSGVIVGRCP